MQRYDFFTINRIQLFISIQQVTYFDTKYHTHMHYLNNNVNNINCKTMSNIYRHPTFRLHLYTVVKVDRRIRWHYTTTILRLRIGARFTRYRNCKFHNGCRTISRHADGISRYSVPPSAGPLLPLSVHFNREGT